MRQHEYRAWTGTKMDYDYRDVSLWNGILVAEGDTILLQWTGLTDKKGVKVFEGDIVKGNNEWIDFGQPLSVVEYKNGTWNYAYALAEYAEQPEKDWEVIGNVWENPELLTSKP